SSLSSHRSPRPHDRVDRPDHQDARRDVVYPQDRRPSHDGNGARRQARFEPLASRQPRDLAEERLAGNPDEDRPSDLGQKRQAVENLEIVVRGLSEPDPGIENDSIIADPGLPSESPGGAEIALDLRHEVLVARMLLHG